MAASLGLAAGSVGTETAGSITCQALWHNVVGIKPTVRHSNLLLLFFRYFLLRYNVS